jgi:hypothetical protein
MLKEQKISNYAKIVAVQSLQEGATPFILCIYGSNGSDLSENVSKRWKFIKTELAKVGVTVMGKFYFNRSIISTDS